MCGTSRETREGWPLLPVETEVNGDSLRTNERGLSLVGSLGSSCRYKRLLSCLGCSGQPSTKYFFPRSIQFQFMCPHRPHRKKRLETFPTPVGMSLSKLSLGGNNFFLVRQSCRAACLWMCVSGHGVVLSLSWICYCQWLASLTKMTHSLVPVTAGTTGRLQTCCSTEHILLI